MGEGAGVVKTPVRHILSKASTIFYISEDRILGSSRLRYISLARFAICRVAREQGWTYGEIARTLGRDTSSANHAAKMCEIWEERDPDFARKLARLRMAAENYTPPPALAIPSQSVRAGYCMVAEQ